MTAPVMPLLTKDIKDWLVPQLPDETIYSGPEVPKYPKRMVLVTPAPGGGLSMEFAMDSPSWQIHVVGPQSRDSRVNHSADQAEELIYKVERAILTAQWPQQIAGHHVTFAQRFGSGPTPLPTDEAGRGHFVATYMFGAESGYGR